MAVKKTSKEAKKAAKAGNRVKRKAAKAAHDGKKAVEKAGKGEKAGKWEKRKGDAGEEEKRKGGEKARGAVEKKEGEKAREAKLPAKALPKASREEQMAAYEILRYPLITEKSVNMIESENKLVFVVAGSATKGNVKKAVESLYGVKVDRVNMLRDMKARKRAIVKIAEGYKADDIATRLGVL